MNLSEILRHSVNLQQEKIAIQTETQALSYQAFGDYCHRMGCAMHSLGLERGDRIAFLDLNSLELAAAHFALPACGMVVLPLNHRLSKQELIGILEDAEPSALVYGPCFGELVDEVRPDIPFVKRTVCTASREGELDLPTVIQSATTIPLDEQHADDLATLLYTSGTTGRPKGVKLSHGNTASTLATLLIELGLTSDDIGLMVAPLFHVAGCHTYMALIARGCTVHLLPGFEPQKTLDAIAESRATVTLLVPAMIGAMLQIENREGIDTSALRRVIYAGAPMPEELLRASIARFGNVFFQIYGLTETSVLTCLRVEDHARPSLLSSAGREMYGCHLRLVDDAGQDVPIGEIGRIIAKGDNVTSGYWNAPEETAASLEDGWFDTGDVAVRNEENFIYLKDRKKDMIVTGGENVYPVEIENVLHEHPGIMEAAVIGVPDNRWGERVIAMIHLRKGGAVSESEIIAFCRDRLAGYKCPKQVVFTGPLPRTPSGKVKKNVLREPYWASFDRGVH